MIIINERINFKEKDCADYTSKRTVYNECG